MDIYVGNLSYDVSENELRRAFEEFGTVESVKIIMDRYTNRSKGFGFVGMNDPDEAKTAMSKLKGSELDGRELKVNEARPRRNRDSGYGSSRRSNW